jgi:hypothetical protein
MKVRARSPAGKPKASIRCIIPVLLAQSCPVLLAPRHIFLVMAEVRSLGIATLARDMCTRSAFAGGVKAWFSRLGFLALISFVARAGIPEPGIVLYGVVRDGTGARLTFGTLEIVYTQSSSGKRVTNSVPLQDLGGAYSYVTEILFETPIPSEPVTANNVFELPAIGGGTHTFSRTAQYLGGPGSTLSGDSITFDQKGSLRELNITFAGVVDVDGDGLPDTWEMQVFGTLSRNGAGDQDGDGMSDLAEFMAGTDPTDPDSLLRLTGIQRVVGGFEIRWTSVSGKTYSLQRSPAANGAFSDIVTGISGTAPENIRFDPASATNIHFYRIKLE